MVLDVGKYFVPFSYLLHYNIMSQITIIFSTILLLVACSHNSDSSYHIVNLDYKTLIKDGVQIHKTMFTHQIDSFSTSQNIYYDSCQHKFAPTSLTYQTYKDRCLQTRKYWLKQYNNAPSSNKKAVLDSAGQAFGSLLMTDGIAFWLGTPWTFEGHTNNPDTGTVACGYLISTLLRHSGIKINRYKLAQLAATDGARTLLGGQISPPLLKYDEVLQQIETLKDGLYKIGLNNHVGFLYISEQKPYFVHSNFINNEGVVFEHLQCSSAFNSSTVFQIVPISKNNFLIKNWLFQRQIPIIKD